MKRAFFLDRDGTINVDRGYVHRIEEWEFIQNAVEAIKVINEHDYLAIIITNQSGIGRGFYSESDMHLLHNRVDKELKRQGACIDAYYFCPHTDSDSCTCRKPQTGLYRRAIEDFDIDATASIAIGDRERDILRVHELGITRISLLEEGLSDNNGYFSRRLSSGVVTSVFSNLRDAVVYWLS